VSEKLFQDAVVEMAKLLGWSAYHTHDSRRSEPGFPDLVLVRDRVLFRELKMGDGIVTAAQIRWLERLERAGADAKVWRPLDWPEIETTLR
jgi:hypothetical protein